MNPQNLAERLKASSVVDTSSKYITTRPLNISALPRDSHMVKFMDNDKTKSSTDANEPLRLEKLHSNIQLLTSNPSGQTSLIPVIVSGDEIFQIQGQQPVQNNVYVLSSPTVSDADCGPGNQGYIPSSSATIPLEIDTVRPGARGQTGFLGFNTHTLDHTITSTSPGLSAAVMSSSVTQSVSSPVYKSKLEKAVAQNLLIQNMAKDSSGVPKSLSVSISNSAQHSSVGLSVQTTTQPSPVYTNLRMSPTRQASSSTTPFIQDSTPDNITSHTDIRHSFSPSKPLTKVSKVAEYYKNLISGKVPPVSQSNTWKQTYDNALSQSQASFQYSLVPDENYPSDSQACVGTFGGTNSVSSFENEMIISTGPALVNSPVSTPDIVKEKSYTDSRLGLSTLESLWKLRADGVLCDAVLIAGNKQIKVNILLCVLKILSQNCPCKIVKLIII